MLGNDVVDLREARALAKEHDERFLARVFTAAEQECIRAARDPALTLWMIWAAKEALFKIASRREPRTIFAHREFPVPGLDAILQAGGGSLCLRDGPLQFQWEGNAEFLHCVVASDSWMGQVEEGKDVRALALRILGIPGARIQRNPGPVRPLAPVVILGKKELPAIVSLSHDGRFVAAALSQFG